LKFLKVLRVSELSHLIEKIKADKFPQAIQIHVARNGKTVFQKKLGKPYKYFDLSSLTKIMATTPLIMKLIDDKRLNLNDSVEKHLGFLSGRPVGQIKIIDLLRHKSGLVWWRPYFKKLGRLPESSRIPELKKIFAGEKVSASKTCVYSDPDFIVLGWVIEEILSMPFDEAANEYVFKPLGLKNTFFLRAQPSKVLAFASTGKDKRRGVIQGFVDDDNTWAMGGVSGHAGLFSTLEDVTHFSGILFQAQKGKSNPVFSSKTLKLFSKRAVPKNVGDWALGFTIPSKLVSTAGTKVSANAFGHVGFTGTSLWIDKERGAVVTILSNGTFPTRDNARSGKLRKELHDAIWEWLDDKK
jgi:CubicO group peptidase (beta-lactamase class C family)